MKPTRKCTGERPTQNSQEAERLIAERARIHARLRELETREMAAYLRPTFSDLQRIALAAR